MNVQFLSKRMLKTKLIPKQKNSVFFTVFLIIHLFHLPVGFIPTNRKQFKAAKLSTFKRWFRHCLYESTSFNHFHMAEWWDNSQQIHQHKFLEAIFNRGFFKPKEFKVLYNSSIHGMCNTVFHERCDNQGPTMTIFTLNGKIVVGILQKSWDVWQNGLNKDLDLQLFVVNCDGTTVELECTSETEVKGFYNRFSCGPAFGGLYVDLLDKTACISFKQRELITGDKYFYDASIDSVVVLQIRFSFESISPAILTRLACIVAPYLSFAQKVSN